VGLDVGAHKNFAETTVSTAWCFCVSTHGGKENRRAYIPCSGTERRPSILVAEIYS
jgi:hypothetical protein